MKVRVTEAHKAFRNDVIAALKKHGDKLSALEMLALAAHLVGGLMAMQDQRTVTREMALDVVAKNVEAGNAEFVELAKTAGRA